MLPLDPADFETCTCTPEARCPECAADLAALSGLHDEAITRLTVAEHMATHFASAIDIILGTQPVPEPPKRVA